MSAWPKSRSAAEIRGSFVCANCSKREGTHLWGDSLAMTHGGAVRWCERCVLEAQIAHAEERAALLPELRSRLAAISDTPPEAASRAPGRASPRRRPCAGTSGSLKPEATEDVV